MIVPTGRGEEIMSELISKERYEDILDWAFRDGERRARHAGAAHCAPHYYRLVLQKGKRGRRKSSKDEHLNFRPGARRDVSPDSLSASSM